MYDGRSNILHYGPLIETNYLYAPTEWAKPECVAKQKQYPHPSLTLKLGSHCRSDQLDRPGPINFSLVALALVS